MPVIGGDTVQLKNGLRGVVETVNTHECWVWFTFGSAWVSKADLTVDRQQDSKLVDTYRTLTGGE